MGPISGFAFPARKSIGPWGGGGEGQGRGQGLDMVRTQAQTSQFQAGLSASPTGIEGF